MAKRNILFAAFILGVGFVLESCPHHFALGKSVLLVTPQWN